MNLETARYNMIEQQVRPWDVWDSNVLKLMAEVPRELFVPADYQNVAFCDMEIPLGHGHSMLTPRLVGRVLQVLKIQSHETVLEIGTGSGYMTALLAYMALKVFSVDIDQDISQEAGRKLASQDISNVMLEVGDGAHGWPNHKPYDVIVLKGSTPQLDDSFRQSLKVGGRIFAVVGDAPSMQAQLITRESENEFIQESLFETVIAPLANAPEPERFKF